MSAYLDTHVAVWLHDGLIERLTMEATRQIEENELLISPMVLLELQYLLDRKRIGVAPLQMYGYLNATFGIGLCTLPFSVVATEALSVGWTSDPFDRVIVAQASANSESRLITADREIRQQYRRACW
ncbi:MAG: PIN domain-containing protein [Bryobacteraceae bacterium]